MIRVPEIAIKAKRTRQLVITKELKNIGPGCLDKTTRKLGLQ